MLSNFIRRKDAGSLRAAAPQPTAGQVRDIVMPLRKRHRLTAAASFDDADGGAVPANDQWTCGGDIDDRAGIILARRRLYGCAKDFDLEIGRHIEPCHIGGRREGLIVSGADKIDNSLRAIIPIDLSVEGVTVSVEPAPRQVLRDIVERFAANDLADNARQEFSPGSKAAAEERQPGIVRPDRKTQLTDNGTSIDPLFHSVDGHAEFPLAIADRPLMGVETGVLWQEPWMKIQAAPFEHLESVGRNNESAVGIDEPPARRHPLGSFQEAIDVNSRHAMPASELGKWVHLRILEHHCVERCARRSDQGIHNRSSGPPLTDHDKPHQS